jgi:hypothetical protein
MARWGRSSCCRPAGAEGLAPKTERLGVLGPGLARAFSSLVSNACGGLGCWLAARRGDVGAGRVFARGFSSDLDAAPPDGRVARGFQHALGPALGV